MESLPYTPKAYSLYMKDRKQFCEEIDDDTCGIIMQQVSDMLKDMEKTVSMYETQLPASGECEQGGYRKSDTWSLLCAETLYVMAPLPLYASTNPSDRV